MDLGGKRILITGGGTGVGRACALRFAAAGARVAICGRRADKLEEVATEAGGGVLTRAADVSIRDDVEALGEWVRRELGGVDVLVNSAGTNVQKRKMEELDPEDWEKLLRINATGAFLCMREVLPGMREQKDGVIVNISSVAGKRAIPLGGVAYNASKFAMTALGTSVSIEEAPNGVRVSNVYPGEINTPILDARPVPPGPEHRARILQAEDVAEAVYLLAVLPPRAHIPELVIKPTLQDYA
ncbi:MAG: SDR family oxidoreductase [Planctomycetota bacterium]